MTCCQADRNAIEPCGHRGSDPLVIDENGPQRSIYKHVNSGGSFGANPLRQTIGLGKASQIVKLEIYWPTTDTTQTFSNVPLDTVIHITAGRH